MKKDGYYSSGEFARKAHVTLRTIRYYDQHNILKPSLVTSGKARYYTDEDFAKLQQILLLKYLGFSLEDIKEMTIGDFNPSFMSNALHMQLRLVQERIEQMQLVEKALQDTVTTLETHQRIDWNDMLHLIHLTSMENSLKTQYQNASNISSRIQLHKLYSQNSKGWFPWLYEQYSLQPSVKVLEIGCGDGTLWTTNLSKLPSNISITLSDISEGMLRDARRAIGPSDSRFSFNSFDTHQIPYPDESFNLVIANHVLFYCLDISKVLSEIYRVLKLEGKLFCSTYGKAHMQEVTQLVQSFDSRILLSAHKLYEKFGRENGTKLLNSYFHSVSWISYEDSLLVLEPEALISYILSCHGNQNQYILDHYKEFRSYVKNKTGSGFFITKDAGIFVCQK